MRVNSSPVGEMLPSPPTSAVPVGEGLVLIGPMGSGKSSLARQLARLTSRRWVDTDKLVVQRVGLPITEIFSREGEAEFRRLESEALGSLYPGERLIIATGGGIVMQTANHAILQRLGCVIFLTASPEVLYERVSRNQHRPLLHTSDPAGTIRELFDRRLPLYRACAHLTVDTSSGTHDDLARQVIERARDFFAAASGNA